MIIVALAVVLGIGVAGYFFGFNPIGDILSTHLTASQIAQLASNAGFSGPDLQTAVAIALAESGGNPNAHGDRNLGSGTGSFGLWQIYSDAHPEFGPDFTSLYDPQTNAQAAFSIYQGRGFSFKDWATFDPKDGSTPKYLAFMDQAGEAVNGPQNA